MPQHIPRNFNKPNMFTQLAAKCIDYGVVCGGGGHITIVYHTRVGVHKGRDTMEWGAALEL